MDELRLMAEKLIKKADEYDALKLTATDDETKDIYRSRVIATLECVSTIYERIFEIQKQN